MLQCKGMTQFCIKPWTPLSLGCACYKLQGYQQSEHTPLLMGTRHCDLQWQHHMLHQMMRLPFSYKGIIKIIVNNNQWCCRLVLSIATCGGITTRCINLCTCKLVLVVSIAKCQGVSNFSINNCECILVQPVHIARCKGMTKVYILHEHVCGLACKHNTKLLSKHTNALALLCSTLLYARAFPHSKLQVRMPSSLPYQHCDM
jgi:hypothetical protein